ncbi:MAG TPA: peptidylprolyl isomerase [Ignavibacteriaceae bacterium]|nr:peptidylprolyl isomerase [Ignavibacteriaceae bacterium]
MYKIILLLLPLILPQINRGQTDEQKIIAKIGSEVINESEFIERYELTPQIYAGMIGGEESLKREVLYSIIAEKLWALEAESMGLDNSELIKSTYKAIEKMYVRDALYRQEILDKINLSDGYLIEAFRRNSLSLNLNYIFAEDETEINDIFKQLGDGVEFYSIFLTRPESSLQEMPYVVGYGQMDKNVEDVLYSLKLSEITQPIKAPNGWYIFRLLSTEQKVIENVQQAEEQQKYVLKVAEKTLTDSVYKDFYARFFKDAVAETNKDIFIKLSEVVIEALKYRSEKESIPAGEKVYIIPEDLYRIEIELGQELLDDEFIKLNDQPATINDFLQELSIEKFYVDSLETYHIKGRLNYAVKIFIEHELLSREGYKRGLQNLPEVQRYLKMWRSYYLTEAVRKEIAQTIQITDEEAYEYFLEKNRDTSSTLEVKIIEVLTEDLDVIQTVLDELNAGNDFRELVAKYTIREEAKNNNGELGFFPVSEYGEIGRKAALMQIGDMYGPIRVTEGYSLFELIDRKEKKYLSTEDFQTEKENIKVELRHKQYSDALINKTVELANKYDVQLNDEALSSIKVLNTTTVVYRYFGFGGRLLAVPMTAPNYLWVKPWQEQEDLTP